MGRARLLLLAGLALAACAAGDSAFVGQWESTFGGISLELKADHTLEFGSMGITNTGTWESTGKNQIVVHGPREDMTLTREEDGSLSTGMLGRFVRKK